MNGKVLGVCQPNVTCGSYLGHNSNKLNVKKIIFEVDREVKQ